MKQRVLYKGREALLSKYFDHDCLLFNRAEGKPLFPDEAIHEYPDLPQEYLVYLWSLSYENRQEIKYLDEAEELAKCICTDFASDDSPRVLCTKGLVNVIGDDTLEYDKGDFADSRKKITVQCTRCKRLYDVNIAMGYRSSYFNWVSKEY